MSQLDDTILDALTHVTFPKGFAQQDYVRQLYLNAASKMC